MFYKTGYCFTSRELFDTLNLKLLNISTKVVRKYKMDCLQDLCGAVLTYCLYLIILDIIENNVTFVLPLLYGNYAEIHITTIEDEKFKNLYKSGRFQNIDFVSSEFSTSRVEFLYRYKGKTVKIPIILKKDLGRLLIKRINEGKKYY